MIEMIPYDKDVEDYIQMVFRYFNGKVNTFNPAVLTIDWAGRYSSSVAAFSILPNRVFINPLVVARYCPAREYLQFQIVEYIIHELFHVDQTIQFKRMNIREYVNAIESAVEVQMVEYYTSHMDEIKHNLGVYIDQGCMDYFDEVLRINSIQAQMHPYERRTMVDHIWMIADQYTAYDYDSSDMRTMIAKAVTGGYDISIEFNDKTIIIRDHVTKPNIEIMSLNYDLQDAYDGIFYNSKVSAKIYNTNPRSLVITINNDMMKIMCKLSSGR